MVFYIKMLVFLVEKLVFWQKSWYFDVNSGISFLTQVFLSYRFKLLIFTDKGFSPIRDFHGPLYRQHFFESCRYTFLGPIE